MDLRLRGKIALVTGSSKGIGEGIARSLHQEGCNVVLNSRHNSEFKIHCYLYEGTCWIFCSRCNKDK